MELVKRHVAVAPTNKIKNWNSCRLERNISTGGHLKIFSVSLTTSSLGLTTLTPLLTSCRSGMGVLHMSRWRNRSILYSWQKGCLATGHNTWGIERARLHIHVMFRHAEAAKKPPLSYYIPLSCSRTTNGYIGARWTGFPSRLINSQIQTSFCWSN